MWIEIELNLKWHKCFKANGFWMLDVLIRAWLGTGRTSGGFHEKKRSHESTWEDRLQVWALGDSSIIRLPISRPFLRSLQGDGGGERICTMVSWHSDGNMNPESGRRPSFPKMELCWHLGGSANDISQTWCGHHKHAPMWPGCSTAFDSE